MCSTKVDILDTLKNKMTVAVGNRLKQNMTFYDAKKSASEDK
jgi:hypothetical protein